MALHSAGVLVLALLLQPAPPLAAGARGLLNAPIVNGKPVDVGIGFYAYDFARVTSRDESFEFWPHVQQLQLPNIFADARAAIAQLHSTTGNN